MDQNTVVYLHNGTLHSKKKYGALPFCDSIGGSGKHYAKWNKPGGEREIPYDLICKWNLINKMN